MRRNVRSIPVRRGSEVLHYAVPPMHPNTPPWVRQRVFEYVLRGQLGLAQMHAEAATQDIEGTTSKFARLKALLEETPHRNARGAKAA